MAERVGLVGETKLLAEEGNRSKPRVEASETVCIASV